jgi:transposase InsO family protein
MMQVDVLVALAACADFLVPRIPDKLLRPDKGMEHTCGAPCHPQTQGKIERWHQTLKNRILLENYFLPGDLERKVAAFVDHYKYPGTDKPIRGAIERRIR